MNLKDTILQVPLIKNWKRSQQIKRFKGSISYWEERYRGHGDSGSGSYRHLAEFKAEILNEFVKKNQIRTVLEFGCGDGNQLTLAEYPAYIGLDVSPTAIKMCHELFIRDTAKSFYLYDSLAFHDHAGLFRAELVLSLDVLFHLVEQEIFETYIRHLFTSAERFVIIYASDFDRLDEPVYRHDKRRKFTPFIQANFPEWELMEVIKNKYPVSEYNDKGSLSDFYIYKKLNGTR